MARVDEPTEAFFLIEVIGLQSESECGQIAAKVRELLPQDAGAVETRTDLIPAVVGELAGFVAVIKAFMADVAADVVAGSIGRILSWLKSQGKHPRINTRTAEAIVESDLRLKLDVRNFKRRRLSVREFDLGEESIKYWPDYFRFVFEDLLTHEQHTYTVSNEGEITSHKVD